MLYTAAMSQPTRKPRLPEPVSLAIAIVERVTGETLVERPEAEAEEAGRPTSGAVRLPPQVKGADHGVPHEKRTRS